MGNKKYIVKLSKEEQGSLNQLISKGKASARKLIHARILLKAETISKHLQVHRTSIERVRKQFVEEGLENALLRKRPIGRMFKKLDGRGEARLIQLASSAFPEGRKSWTLQLLADKLVELEIVESISYETVRQTLKKMNFGIRNNR